jgi:hypothetical protein
MKKNNLVLTDQQLGLLKMFLDRADLKVAEVPQLMDLIKALSSATPIEDPELKKDDVKMTCI